MDITKTVKSSLTGRDFTARILRKHDRYGLNSCKIWGDEPGIEFYDATYANQKGFDALGQFVSRYYLETIAGAMGALILDGGIPEWKIDVTSMGEIRAWIEDLRNSNQLGTCHV